MKISLEGLSSRSEQGGGGVGGEVSKSEDRTIEINQSERQRKKMKLESKDDQLSDVLCHPPKSFKKL